MSFGTRVEVLLAQAGLEPGELRRLISVALEEDLRYGRDVTSEATIEAGAEAAGDVVAREAGVLCGAPVALAVLETVGFPLNGVDLAVRDGERVEPGTVVVNCVGPLRLMLLAERTMLNFMTHLSGIATCTAAWADILAGTGCRVRDTRKTTPGLRQLEKYAVRCGGGVNHRLGLGDGALIKDNHVAGAGGVGAAVRALRSRASGVELEVECDTLDQVREALDAGARLILLDNMDLESLRAAVALGRGEGVCFEASGSMTLERARAVAETGVSYIAVGALTHSSPALDLALDVRDRT
ncbi:MAG: carboxylating nicotinate-nucleotide diphosphorylase [Acidimicrobiales bacterium]|jgi:nicotinate-nucleotide pyrophosphorylase (carboxylating)